MVKKTTWPCSHGAYSLVWELGMEQVNSKTVTSGDVVRATVGGEPRALF